MTIRSSIRSAVGTTCPEPGYCGELNHRFAAELTSKVGLPVGSRVLDFGCGAGVIVINLLLSGFDAHGAEVFYAGGSYREQAAASGMLGSRILEIVDGRLPYEDAWFDAVVSNQVLEHVADLDGALREVARVLKPEGLFIALFPSREVWREGHVGIPYLHWFPRGSKLRVSYARALHALGLGYHRAGKSGRQWAHDACSWIDAFTHYRRKSDIFAAFGRDFYPLERHEHEYLTFRLARLRVPRTLLRRLESLRLGKWFAMCVVEKLGGMVLVARRRGTCTVAEARAGTLRNGTLSRENDGTPHSRPMHGVADDTVR
jgi:SAM-dependent methyltransferase